MTSPTQLTNAPVCSEPELYYAPSNLGLTPDQSE
jgi:hypothetical protein